MFGLFAYFLQANVPCKRVQNSDSFIPSFLYLYPVDVFFPFPKPVCKDTQYVDFLTLKMGISHLQCGSSHSSCAQITHNPNFLCVNRLYPKTLFLSRFILNMSWCSAARIYTHPCSLCWIICLIWIHFIDQLFIQFDHELCLFSLTFWHF